jgi:hypothetical protein
MITLGSDISAFSRVLKTPFAGLLKKNLASESPRFNHLNRLNALNALNYFVRLLVVLHKSKVKGRSRTLIRYNP